MFVEIYVNNNNKTLTSDCEHEKTEILSDGVNKPESSEPKKVGKKRGRPKKVRAEDSKNNDKEKQKIFHSTPKKAATNFMEFNDDDDDDDDDDILPTAEELFDKSFHEFSQNYDSKDDIKNVKDQNPFEIIESIFSSSDDDDIFMDKTLKIPGEGVLAYYRYDKKFHPAKILSYMKSSKSYKLRFWTGYISTLKRNKFYTKYQPEFLTVELGNQRSEKDFVKLRRFKEEELNDYIKEFIPMAQSFLKKYSWRYKEFINLELNSVKTHKELIKNYFLGILSNSEIEYTIDQFKLALVHKSLVLEGLPITINISEDKLVKSKEDTHQDSNKNNNDQPLSGHVTRRMKKKLFTDGLTDSQKTNESDTLMSSLCVNELSFIDKLCRYILLPEFSIWINMQLKDIGYDEAEKLCRDNEQSYDWVTEILHYRETFSSGRYFIKENQNGKYLNINDKGLKELKNERMLNKEFKDSIAIISINLLKEDTLKFLDTKGFKAIIIYTPKSTIKKTNFILEAVKEKYRDNRQETVISISLQNPNQKQIPWNENPILLKHQKRNESKEEEKEKEKEEKEEKEESHIKLYSRPNTLTSYEAAEEEDSGLLVLWIVLGVIGFMFAFVIISYVVNYIIYSRRNNIMETTERDSTFATTTINPMPLGIINFGHSNQQNLSKEDLDKCPVFRFKNKRHQYKNSNGKKFNLPFSSNHPNNKDFPKNKFVRDNGSVDSFTNKNEMVEKDHCKECNTINSKYPHDNNNDNNNNNNINNNNKHTESSIRFIFDEDKKEYASSIKSASITSSYSEAYNHLSFNPETSTSAEICAICIDQYQLNDELRKLPCGHEFHKDVKKIYI
ncbi:hypothetical protein PIROE2DRAFT_62429 [Piromyces sp. E2]|nr:hypothetical protein PIROE2DRAFT_62429 [Piromyces sp. E2]|eukprot:OUM61547.1 hypothetical protein PIROE2DRAFT_62429 [Piromyces sp. E2]